MGYFELNRPMVNPGNTAGSNPAANLSCLFLISVSFKEVQEHEHSQETVRFTKAEYR